LKEGGRGGGMLEDLPPCKMMHTANASAVKAVKLSWSRSIWNPAACTYQDTADNYMYVKARNSLLLTLLNSI